ncbi:hypothetical protein QTI27_27910 [Variovorax sp. J31P216]|nr:hypothetical protein [Variovorax sp. J31P216]
MRELVTTAQKEGRIPIVAGFSRQLPSSFMTREKMEGRDRADAEARGVASSMRVEFADLGAASPVQMADHVHPDQEYSLRLTERLIAALDRAAPECTVGSAKSSIVQH